MCYNNSKITNEGGFNMFGDSKYSNVLTVILVIVIVAIIALLIFFGIDIYTKYYITKEASDAADQFNDGVNSSNIIYDDDDYAPSGENLVNDVPNDPLSMLNNTTTQTPNTNQSTNNPDTEYFKGFVMKGTIEIPKTDVNLPVLAKATKDAIEVAVAIQYGVGLNKPGNTVIVGHNYRNGQFFSNNKKLEVGDKIKITTKAEGEKTYIIYSKFPADQSDTSFFDRDTQGKCEITLSTCLDNDATRRTIILAKEE